MLPAPDLTLIDLRSGELRAAQPLPILPNRVLAVSLSEIEEGVHGLTPELGPLLRTWRPEWAGRASAALGRPGGGGLRGRGSGPDRGLAGRMNFWTSGSLLRYYARRCLPPGPPSLAQARADD